MKNINYLDVDEFFRDAREVSIGRDVAEDVRRENDRAIATSEAMRDAGFDGEAWSELGSRVFGYEGKI